MLQGNVLDLVLEGLTAVGGDSQEHQNENTEEDNESSQDLVLREEEGLGTIGNVRLNLVQTLRDSGVHGSITTLSLNQSSLGISAIHSVLNPMHYSTHSPRTSRKQHGISDTAQTADRSNR